jgi:hypothetical protein
MSALVERKWITLLFNPSVYFAGWNALGKGLGLMVLALLIAQAGGVVFDGVLDMHLGGKLPWTAPAFGLIDWLCLSAVLVLCGKLVSKTAFRVVDVFGTQALARWPTVLMALIALPPAFGNYSRQLVDQVTRNPLQLPPLNADAIYFFAATLLMLPLIVWMIALMYTAYAVSCNLRGLRAGLSFTLGLILAEILSKLAIYALLRAT